MYDIKEINKTIDRLKMPKEYRRRIVNLENFFKHDITIQLSIREDAGKTTQAMILGLVLNKLYGKTIEYLRCDRDQTTKGNVETLFDVVLKKGYVNKLWKEYNTIIYKPLVKKFFLAFENEKGEIVYEDKKAICHVSSNEEYLRLKSSYNNPDADYIVFDEFLDSSRSTLKQMVEFQNNISTIGRNREDCHVLLLGNNINRYSFWWEEFTIEEEISTLNYGSVIDKTTDLGTTLYCELLEISDKQISKITNKKVRFSGFNTPKMAAFNGVQAWQGSSYPHIPDERMLSIPPFMSTVWISHRGRFIRLEIYHDNEWGHYIFCHFSDKPKKNDAVIFTIAPQKANEFYGFGEAEPVKIRKIGKFISDMMHNNRVYYSTNSVGELLSDYKKSLL